MNRKAQEMADSTENRPLCTSNKEFYPENQWERLFKGKGPIDIVDGATLQLHHPNGRVGTSYYQFNIVSLTDHMEIHYGKR